MGTLAGALRPLASAALWVSGWFPELPKLEDWPRLSCSTCQSIFLSGLKNPLVTRLGVPKNCTFMPHPLAPITNQ